MLKQHNVAMLQHLNAMLQCCNIKMLRWCNTSKQFCNVSKFLPLTLSDATFEKRRKVWGGALSAPPWKTMKELSETPCCYLEVGPISKWSSHEKKSGRNLKNWSRFRDLKIWWNWDFASAWLRKIRVTRSFFEIKGSSSGFSLIFTLATNCILRLRL